ncbi:1,4-dihydroxy-2-naphthoate octaprenyltransferase [Alkalicoccus halolimnae]|uniref:1,4-dihydroxy-2-naphthoate octaprenyltransferase n=1 Tax=Alkalicoccus halolimnae TaxID=1667239 RepID=A0A5C7FCJ6_9BACI|nr:1,4-dihydroxy-2-naphthoate octaprenyltransferase [Alkalicoccus halolimnae]TXF87200.1 1,4-dihydroxy-2-naphthoate octaprenyltransferase [Alkalicoccus halolimnae]
MAERTKEEILDYLNRAEVSSVGTSNMGKPRQRMMHFAVDDEFNVYLSSMKGDPKVIQWSNIPETAMLIHQGQTFMEMEECEIIGRAQVVRGDKEREKATDLLKNRSPIVGNFVSQGAVDRLEFIKVKPYTVKYRFVPEILQGEAPTVFDLSSEVEGSADSQDILSRLNTWKEAVRPLSLTASFIPALLGGAMAFSMAGIFSWPLLLLTVLAAVMVQAGTNMINDFKDAERDAENTGGVRPFTGGSKMIQLGLISKADMGFFGIVLTAAAGLIGLYLAFVSGPGILPLIVYGLIAGFFYTNGKGKFSFINLSPGIAEFLIATTYGTAMTVGAYYVQTGSYSLEVFLVSIPVAALITNVLLINQFPDAESDAEQEKETLVVRIGKKQAKNVLIALFITAFAAVIIIPIISEVPATVYIAFLSLPFMVQAIRYANKHYDGQPTELIPGNAHTAIHHLLTGLLLIIAFVMMEASVWFTLLISAGTLVFVFWVWKYIERQRKVMSGFKKAFAK